MAQSFGLATVLLFNSFSSLGNPSDVLYYHAQYPTFNVALPPLIWLIVITLTAFLLLQLTFRTRAYMWVGLGFSLTAAYGLFGLRHLLMASLGTLQARFHARPALVELYHLANHVLLPLFVLFAVWVVWKARTHRGLLRGAQATVNIVLFSTALIGLVTLFPVFGYLFYRPAAVDPYAPYRATSAAHPRLVWIVFDELSYQQVYGNRWPGLALPAFDRLAEDSTVYTQVQPVGFATEKILPSLINGDIYDDTMYRKGSLIGREHSSGKWVAIQTPDSVFRLAHDNGWNSAISGWYNPYCRVYATYVQACFRSSLDVNANQMMLGSGVAENMGLEFEAIFHNVLSSAEVRNHTVDAQTIAEHAAEMMADPRNDFIFIHVPMPHPPVGYDRRTGTFSDRPGRSYADGLAYTDKILSSFVAVLQGSPRWAQTTLIINGDHSWRVPLWRPTPDWTPEDQAMTHGGVFDDRPALIIHYPGQTDRRQDSDSVSLMMTHDLTAKVLGGTPGSGVAAGF